MRHHPAPAWPAAPQQQFSFFDSVPTPAPKKPAPAHAVIRHRLLGAGELALGAVVAAALPTRTRAIIVTHNTHRARLLARELSDVLGSRREVSLLTPGSDAKVGGLSVTTPGALTAELLDHPNLLEGIGCMLVERGELLADAEAGPTLELLLTRVRASTGSMPRMVIWLDGSDPAAGDVESELNDWLGLGPQGAMPSHSSRALPLLPLGRLIIHAVASGETSHAGLLELARRSLTARRLWRGTRGMGRLRAAMARAIDACARAGLLTRSNNVFVCTPRGHAVARFGLDLETAAALATWGRRTQPVAPLCRLTELALTPHGHQIAAALPRVSGDARGNLLAEARTQACEAHPVFAWLAQSLATLKGATRRALLFAELVHASILGESIENLSQRVGCEPRLLAALFCDFGVLIQAQMSLTPAKSERHQELAQLAQTLQDTPLRSRTSRPAPTSPAPKPRRRTIRRNPRANHTLPTRPTTLPLAGLD